MPFLMSMLFSKTFWIAVIVAALVGKAWFWHHGKVTEAVDAARTEWRVELEQVAAAETKRQQGIETERLRKLKEADDANRKELDLARADAGRASAAVAGLRSRLAALGRAGSGNPAAAASGPPAAEVGNLLGDCAARYSELAVEADAARSAGAYCERAYDALKAAP